MGIGINMVMGIGMVMIIGMKIGMGMYKFFKGIRNGIGINSTGMGNYYNMAFCLFQVPVHLPHRPCGWQ